MEGILNQVDVEITWIVADILTNPVRFFKRLFLGFKFDFRDHQPLVCSMEFINLPAKISDSDFCPMFEQSWLFADMFQMEFSIIDTDSIILLDPSKCNALSIEVELYFGFIINTEPNYLIPLLFAASGEIDDPELF